MREDLHEPLAGVGAIRSGAMSDVRIHETTPPGEASAGGRLLRIVAVLVLAGLVIALATWQVGPRPKAADSGFPKEPPPLVLPTGTAKDSSLGRAAALLATGNLGGARAGFTDVVADEPDGVAGQVGLVLARWRSTGPQSVERDLAQLTREYPDSALASLHLGLVQTLLGEQRAARATLRDALQLGRDAGDPTSLRMARLADDLLHPTAFKGAFPVLVQATEVRAADQPSLRRLLAAVTADDAAAAAGEAAKLARSSDAMSRVAAIAAQFDKDDAAATTARLDAIATTAKAPGPARDRARFLSALAGLWGGGDRAQGCAVLRASTSPATDAGTRRLAVAIAGELCDPAKQD